MYYRIIGFTTSPKWTRCCSTPRTAGSSRRASRGPECASVHHPPYRSIGHSDSVHQTPNIGPSDTKVSVHQTPNPEDLPPNFSPFLAYPHPVTRARDLNNLFNVLTPDPSHRLKRGLRPLGASNPPNPPYPHKVRPTGEPQNKNTAPPPCGRRENDSNGSQAR